MPLFSYLKDAYLLFDFYKLRFIFSLSSVIVALATISALMVINVSVKENSKQLLKKYGESRFVVNVTPVTVHEWKIIREYLTPERVQIFIDKFKSQFQVIPYQAIGVNVRYFSQKLDAMLIASLPEIFTLLEWHIEQGRRLHALDKESKIAVIGKEVANVLYKKNGNIIGELLGIEGQYYTVAGVIEAKEYNPMLDFDVNRSIFVHLNRLNRFPQNQYIDSFIVEGSTNLENSENEFRENISGFWGISSILVRDASIYQKALENQVKLTVNILKMVAIVTLFLALCSLLNLFIILFNERKREIGLRFALGATFRHVSLQLLSEICVMILVGAFIGACLGHLIAFIILHQLQLTFYQNLTTWLVGLPIALSIGILSGVLPLLFIAKQHPLTLINSGQ